MQTAKPYYRKGQGDLDVTVRPATEGTSLPFKLVYARIHFRGTGTPATADVTISLDSIAGEEHDVLLYTARGRGLNADLNLVWDADERADPSAWSFQAGDGLRFQWANAEPENVEWGLEVGLQM